MNLTISSVNNLPKARNCSFGLAKFSEQGLKLAQSCSDIYECLGQPNEFQNPDFFKKKGIFSKAPFTKYLKQKVSPKTVNEEARTEVAEIIRDCGATQNSHTNAAFIKQFLTAKKQINKSDRRTQEAIAQAAEEVFKHNWNNPELSKEETASLLELARGAIDDSKYATLTGIIQKSDI